MEPIWIVLIILVVIAAGVVFIYNGLVQRRNVVDEAWNQISVQLKRRHDLIPNLVNAVKGYMDFEQETLTKVVEARSKVGQMTVGADVLNDPGKFAQFQAAQDELSGALSRLMVVVERYPELKAVANFTDLQHQLEGTENRITVERQRFNEVAKSYNTMLKQVPRAWFVKLLGWNFQEKPYFQAQQGAAEAPKVQF